MHSIATQTQTVGCSLFDRFWSQTLNTWSLLKKVRPLNQGTPSAAVRPSIQGNAECCCQVLNTWSLLRTGQADWALG